MAKNFKELIFENKWSGVSWKIFLCMVLITIWMVYTKGYMRDNFLVIYTILGVFGIFFGEIGDRIPIWNSYIGGGTVLVFLVAAVMGTYKLIPIDVLKNIDIFYGEQPVNFLELFIPALIVGSVLTIDRKTLLHSIAGYIPLIVIGVCGATVGGILMGLVFGKSPVDVVMNYVLPIMGGGTGAGAIPMSEMWAQKTGRPSKEWFAFAISILTVANVIAIFTGALLKEWGKKCPKLTGNGELIISNSKQAVKESETKYEAGQSEFAAALLFIGVLFMASHISSEIWKSFKLPFEMHRLAFLVVYCIILNILDFIPDYLKAGAKKVQIFFSKYTIWILMAAVGFGTDVKEILNALTFGNLAIALAIVFGAVGLIMIVAKAMKFYPIEAGITAGLCMANRGGSGDIAVLGAADRMELISFAQISSRVGGAMMLVLGSIIFGYFA